MIWGTLISAAADLAGGYISSKKEKAVAKQKLEVAKIEAQTTKALQDGEWEHEAIKATDGSWKDEFALCVLLAPAIAVYWVPEKVQAGFDVLSTLPERYTYLLFIAISSSFGIKGVGQAAKMLRKK